MKIFTSTNDPKHPVTRFKYNCEKCHKMDYWLFHRDYIQCVQCSNKYPLSPNKVLLFDHTQTEQNKHFDKLYASGYSPLTDQYVDEYEEEYHTSKDKVKDLLKLWRLDKTLPIVDKAFLDVACGPGWLTAGLMQQRRIRNATFHACDISATGLEMLATFAKNNKTSHELELSVQNAEKLRFEKNSFDFIIGHSMLHHLPDYETFLKDCRRFLKPGGIALFGEPFALGYGLLAACLKIAQNDLGTNYDEIQGLYDNITYRITQPKKRLKSLVDKHLFFQSEISQLVQQIGFSSVEFVSFMNRDYYQNQFVSNELRLSYGINDEQLIKRASTIYKTIFDIFNSDRFVNALSAFIYIILKK